MRPNKGVIKAGEVQMSFIQLILRPYQTLDPACHCGVTIAFASSSGVRAAVSMRSIHQLRPVSLKGDFATHL